MLITLTMNASINGYGFPLERLSSQPRLLFVHEMVTAVTLFREHLILLQMRRVHTFSDLT